METGPTPPASENPTGRESYRPLVLVVDDDRDSRTIYREYLRAMGCRVITARDGGAAIDQAVLRQPDVIVMDLAMPHMDGLTATRHLRRQAATRRVPIIAVTAVATSRDSARRAGCDAFLAKPCLLELLWWEVRALMAHAPSRRATWARSADAAPRRRGRPRHTV
jgi:CheY-like chemotaxis protein